MKMLSRALCTLVFLTFTCRGAAEESSQAKEIPAQAGRPNIVLIMADDMGYECVGANGSDFYKTPHLDRLAAGGMRFAHAYSQPLCTPSRVQIMTGRYNVRNYVKFGVLHPQEITFGNMLKQAGYATCVVGKWQLQGGFEGPQQFGFDEYCLWQLTRRPTRYPNPGLEINGKQVDYGNGEYGPDVVSDYLIDFLRRNKAGPFFAYYPMILPHWPFQPTRDSADWDPQETKEWPSKKWNRSHFRDMVHYTDKIVGKIDNALRELGIRENTLLIFTTDNGTATSITSPFRGDEIKGGKGATTDAGTHVPMIASWPGTIPPGAVSQNLIDFSDFVPTLAELAGVPDPSGRPIDGRSFAAQLRGQQGKPRDWIYCWYSRPGGATGREFARNQRYKLYRSGEFYDIKNDRLEKRPIQPAAASAKARQVHAILQSALDRYSDARPADIANWKKKKNKARP